MGLPPLIDGVRSQSLDLPSQTLTEDEQQVLHGLLAAAAKATAG